jgi:hypothetical protein
MELWHPKPNARDQENIYSKYSNQVKEFIFSHIISLQIIQYTLCISRSKISMTRILSPIALYYCSIGNLQIITVADSSIIPAGIAIMPVIITINAWLS